MLWLCGGLSLEVHHADVNIASALFGPVHQNVALWAGAVCYL